MKVPIYPLMFVYVVTFDGDAEILIMITPVFLVHYWTIVHHDPNSVFDIISVPTT